MSDQLPVQRRGLVRRWSTLCSWTVPAVQEMAVSADCRRQMLYYRRNHDQERCHADRGEADAASGLRADNGDPGLGAEATVLT